MTAGQGGTASHSAAFSQVADAAPMMAASRTAAGETPHRTFRVIWYGVNTLLFLSLMAWVWGLAWEYSTNRYLKGFSDAIVPFSAPPVQKVQAILTWMSHTPEHFGQAPASLDDDRNPTDTLNYASLLKVCGTATNAFINLADSGGLTARRLLLLDANSSTIHVVAEVLINGRWVVVDPTFHTIFRGPDGGMLTNEELAVPAVFRFATQNISGYDPRYVFDHAVHIRLSELGPAGRMVRKMFGVPNWEGLPVLSLILERESLEMAVLCSIVALFLLLLRALLRWYAGARLGIRTTRIRDRLRRVTELVLDPAD
jgi:hypothetical protein